MMLQFKESRTIPNLNLPTTYDECDNMHCSECVLHSFLDNNSCQFNNMLVHYKHA